MRRSVIHSHSPALTELYAEQTRDRHRRDRLDALLTDDVLDVAAYRRQADRLDGQLDARQREIDRLEADRGRPSCERKGWTGRAPTCRRGGSRQAIRDLRHCRTGQPPGMVERCDPDHGTREGS